jgi:nicotinamide-nucleotide amidase
MERGFVTYTNEAKVELLGVPEALLEKHGAVSEPVAEAMARGALARSPADLALSITGVAGPEGGTEHKPVGTVCIGWGDQETVQTKTYSFPFDRERNRLLSAWAAFGRLYRRVSRKDR